MQSIISEHSCPPRSLFAHLLCFLPSGCSAEKRCPQSKTWWNCACIEWVMCGVSLLLGTWAKTWLWYNVLKKLMLPLSNLAWYDKNLEVRLRTAVFQAFGTSIILFEEIWKRVGVEHWENGGLVHIASLSSWLKNPSLVSLTWAPSPLNHLVMSYFLFTNRGPAIEKIVVVIGETGVGKSTIVNMLYNRDYSVDCCTQPQKTGSTSAAVTRFSTMQFDFFRKWLGCGWNIRASKVGSSLEKNTSTACPAVVLRFLWTIRHL